MYDGNINWGYITRGGRGDSKRYNQYPKTFYRGGGQSIRNETMRESYECKRPRINTNNYKKRTQWKNQRSANR